jgi:hypothetical protein
MREERLEVSVTFDERHGYVASAPELRSPVVALSLGGLRRKIEIAMLPDDVRVVLQLDGLAERERHRRRAQAQLSRIAQHDQRTALPDQCLHSAEADIRPPRRKWLRLARPAASAGDRLTRAPRDLGLPARNAVLADDCPRL